MSGYMPPSDSNKDKRRIAEHLKTLQDLGDMHGRLQKTESKIKRLEAALKQPKVISFSVGMQGAGGGPYDRTECLSTKEKSQVDESEWKKVSTIIGETIGEASMCWEPRPTGIFDSSLAQRAWDNCMKRLKPHLALGNTVEPETDELKYQAGLPKVPQSEETRALTKRILELEKERDTFEARWELIKADNEELEKEKAELKLELNGYYKLAASGVWVETEDYAAQHNQRDQLRAECARLRDEVASQRDRIQCLNESIACLKVTNG